MRYAKHRKDVDNIIMHEENTNTQISIINIIAIADYATMANQNINIDLQR